MTNYEKLREEAINWIKEWFEKNGKDCKAIVGISGGKDSTVAAALCARALGPENVIGVSMPDSGQTTNSAKEICDALGINYILAPISKITYAFNELSDAVTVNHEVANNINWSKDSKLNIPPRIRMTMLYALSQTYNGRVCGTCNFSEYYLGYFTKWGDGVSDFEPLLCLTCSEVIELGYTMPEIKKEWLERKPDDGLPGSKTDEEKFGFTYKDLDNYILNGEGSNKLIEKIEDMHDRNYFKSKCLNIDYFDTELLDYEN